MNGVASKSVFGVAATDAWQWIEGGSFALERGKAEIRLRDLSGWWGRCDAVVLTTGAAPTNEPEAIARQRQQCGGTSATVKQHGPYDLVVVGGGLAGCARQRLLQARHGCTVALIQDRPILGGNASAEIRVAVSGDTSKELFDPRETGNHRRTRTARCTWRSLATLRAGGARAIRDNALSEHAGNRC